MSWMKKGSSVLPAEETAMFCEQIAMMLDSGLMLADGMDALYAAYKESPYAERFLALKTQVHLTGTLYEAVKQSGLFPKYMVEMVNVGEMSGTLERTMKALAQYYHGEAQVRADMKSAFVYPMLLAGVMLVFMAVLILQVLPLFERVISGLPPALIEASGAARSVGMTLGHVVLIVLCVMVVLCIAAFFLMRSKKREKLISFFMRVFPPARHVAKLLSSARFADVMGNLLAGGYPINEALELVPKLMSDKETLQKVALLNEYMDAGDDFAQAIAKAQMFDPLYEKMLLVGQSTGQIDRTLQNLSVTLREQADEKITRMTGMAEPVIVGVLAVILGALLLSVMLPLAGVLLAL